VLFYVSGGEHGERPEVILKVAVNQHGMGHAAYCEVGSFGDAILGQRVRDCFFICDALCLAVGFHLALNEFRCIVDTKSFDLFATEIFSSCLKLAEERESFVVGFHEEEGDKVRVAINEEDVIGKFSIGRGERSTDVTMDTFKEACGAMK
jgi:hypothetical protein